MAWSELYQRVREYLTADAAILAEGWDATAEVLAEAFKVDVDMATRALYVLVAQGYIDYESGVLSLRETPELPSDEEVDRLVNLVRAETASLAAIAHLRSSRGSRRRPGDGRPPSTPRR